MSDFIAYNQDGSLIGHYPTAKAAADATRNKPEAFTTDAAGTVLSRQAPKTLQPYRPHHRKAGNW